ncbi:flagellar basal-body rod protein FlgG [Candidatus Riflebacteria bacterium]
MLRSLYSASTGMKAQEMNMDVISNNLANVNTNGFKKSRVEFQDLIYQTFTEPGTPESNGILHPTGRQGGHGVRPIATQKIFAQGNYQATDNPLDWLIEGQGFFRILKPDGNIGYTRDGSLKLSEDGTIVNHDGYPLDPQIQIPENAIGVNVTPGGVVAVKLPGQTDLEVVGQIALANFINPGGLKAIGKNLFVETPASGAPIENNPNQENLGAINQGFVESSNVKMVEEMVNMILAQRAYETNSRTIQTADQMLQTATQLKRT